MFPDGGERPAFPGSIEGTGMAETRITGGQVRMARAFLRWSIADLADKAGVGISTVQAIEAAADAAEIDAGGLATTRDYRAGARAETLGKIATAFSRAGVTFLPDDGKGPGIRGRAKGAKR
jgi:transcriptional regulator with XRE-family HTH domain